MWAVTIPHLEGGSIRPRFESCVNCDGPISMVPCLHQENIYTKRKLRIWIGQKCIPLIAAITPLTCADRQNTQSRVRLYMAQKGKFGKMGRTYGHDTVFAPRKYLYQNEATGMERLEMYSDSRCNNPNLTVQAVIVPRLEGDSIGPGMKFGKLRRTYGHGTVFVPRKYTKRKPRVWRNQKCNPLVGAITQRNCAGYEITPSRGRQYRAQNRKIGKLGRTYGHGTVFAPRKYLHQKEATGMERPEMYSVSSCNNPTYLCGPSKYPVSREAV